MQSAEFHYAFFWCIGQGKVPVHVSSSKTLKDKEKEKRENAQLLVWESRSGLSSAIWYPVWMQTGVKDYATPELSLRSTLGLFCSINWFFFLFIEMRLWMQKWGKGIELRGNVWNKKNERTFGSARVGINKVNAPIFQCQTICQDREWNTESLKSTDPGKSRNIEATTWQAKLLHLDITMVSAHWHHYHIPHFDSFTFPVTSLTCPLFSLTPSEQT